MITGPLKYIEYSKSNPAKIFKMTTMSLESAKFSVKLAVKNLFKNSLGSSQTEIPLLNTSFRLGTHLPA